MSETPTKAAIPTITGRLRPKSPASDPPGVGSFTAPGWEVELTAYQRGHRDACAVLALRLDARGDEEHRHTVRFCHPVVGGEPDLGTARHAAWMGGHHRSTTYNDAAAMARRLGESLPDDPGGEK